METKKEYFEFLDHLRLSGVTNMAGAAIYLRNKFGINRDQASEVLFEWLLNCKKGRLKRFENE